MKALKAIWRFLRWQDATIKPVELDEHYYAIRGD